MITTKAFGGLCNRMRAIDSTIALGEKLEKKICIIWEKNQDLNCPFDLLFKPISNIEIKESIPISIKQPLSFFNYYNTHDPNQINNPLKRYIKKILTKEKRNNKKIYDQELLHLFNTKFNFESLRNFRKIYLSSYFQFYHRKNSFQEFQPTPFIQTIITKLINRFNNHTIGIHIRRTDNLKSIQNSPLDLFITAIKKEIKTNHNANFFLATDDLSVEHTLKEQFPNRIITYPKIIDRNSIQGMQDAVVDLYALSKTTKIYGSYWSSFSQTAAGISDIEIEILMKK